MKSSVLLLLPLLFIPSKSAAQSEIRTQTQLEVSVGYAQPVLFSGDELRRSRRLRNEGLSYLEADDGSRRSVGSYPANRGLSLQLGMLKPVSKARGLLIGGIVRTALTGSQPSEGGYEEGFFLNTLQIGMAGKYYPFSAINVFFGGDLGVAAVFTKNRFVSMEGEQRFHHNFGIGFGGSMNLGYTFTPFGDDGVAFEGKLLYELATARVEVDAIGDDQWTYGTLHVTVGAIF